MTEEELLKEVEKISNSDNVLTLENIDKLLHTDISTKDIPSHISKSGFGKCDDEVID